MHVKRIIAFLSVSLSIRFHLTFFAMAENGSSEAAIEVLDLHFSFPSATSKIPALSGVDLVLPKGSPKSLRSAA